MDSLTNKSKGATEEPKRSRSRSVSPATSGSSSSRGNATKSKRKSTSLPPETVEYLKAWMMSPEHISHPYPTDQEKAEIMADTGIELKQLTNWFVNNRKRFWKPRVEARLREQAQAQASANAAVVNLIKPDGSHSKATQLSDLSLGSNVIPSSPNRVHSLLDGPPPALTATSLMRLVSPPRTVSEQSSLASESGSVTSNSDDADDLSTGQTTEEMDNDMIVSTETVNVHVLRPVSGRTPSLEDVTILQGIPSERILRTFENCALTYKISRECAGDRKVQSRRDAEIVRVKKQYLKIYLGLAGENIVTLTKRRHSEGHDEPSPRRKYRRVSVDLWKEVCQTANCGYDHELPSLEEATQLFGYTC